MSDLLDRARSVGPVVRAHADEAEEARRLSAPVVAALVEAGLMRLCVPAVYGGPEVTPMELVEAIAAVAEADGAAGWCVMIASTTSSMSCFLEPAWAKEIYADPSVVTGGAFAPTGQGPRRRGRLPRHRPVDVGQRHAALRLDHGRIDDRRRQRSTWCSRPRPTSRSSTPGSPRACGAPGRTTSR